MVGGALTEEAFRGWLAVWRSKYQDGLWHAHVPDPWESLMPEALRGVPTKLVKSEGGVASGIVTEGMGYGLMIEGFQAARGSETALSHGLALMKSWLGLVNGPAEQPHPFAGGADYNDSATRADFWPYGVSAVMAEKTDLAPAGLPAWKFPVDQDDIDSFMGSAADGDQDAILGMIYLAASLDYPDDFVDVVARSIIAFASADLGFPDMYRTLPDNRKVFVPKLGSMWGGLLPPGGKFKTKQEPWCFSPGYFAPAHYRAFRDFMRSRWRSSFEPYLPQHLDGQASTLEELLDAFDGAVTAGYNILYYSSCSSGSVSNWVGVESACPHNDTLHCPGVPWASTPYVGESGGTCSQSDTKWGSYGPDASRAAWRIAMDYVLYRNESTGVLIFDRAGHLDASVDFGARSYLNRIVMQYKTHSHCDGGEPHNCMRWTPSPYQLAFAFDPKVHAPNVTCANVPRKGESWWAGFMAYPTFAAFVAPYDEIGAVQMAQWMDTLSSICNFSGVNTTDYAAGDKPKGKLCLDSYFEASQAVIATMLMAGKVPPLPGVAQDPGVPDRVVDELPQRLPPRRPAAFDVMIGVQVSPTALFKSGSGPGAPTRPEMLLSSPVIAMASVVAVACVSTVLGMCSRRVVQVGAVPARVRAELLAADYTPVTLESEFL